MYVHILHFQHFSCAWCSSEKPARATSLRLVKHEYAVQRADTRSKKLPPTTALSARGVRAFRQASSTRSSAGGGGAARTRSGNHQRHCVYHVTHAAKV
ncbi:hypothetical protein PC121_g13005 [Phytophthora cactorum]|nr:hypothetical protein PC120_g21185 [Phytophthora cactorum]KAG3061430.1 hypothetical protein PC121_g13005 [Phytophthora cactorum]